MKDCSTRFCHCGRPLHYKDIEEFRFMLTLTAQLGEYIPVTMGKTIYRVQRHYVALHGLKGSELPMLGFQEMSSHGS